MNLKINSEFNLFHQIAFSNSPNLYKPNKNSQEIIRKVGVGNYRLWTLESARDLLTSEYNSEVVKAFDSMSAFAHKANIARYCILNHFGGTYLDLAVGKLKEFSIDGRDMVIFAEGNSDRTSWKVANSFFYSKSKNPILVNSIEEILRNVSSRYYGHDPHFIGGPSVFGRAIAKYGLEVNLLVGKYYWFKYRRNKFVLPKGYVVARHKRGGAHKGGMSGVLGGNNYNEIWRARSVYGESKTIENGS